MANVQGLRQMTNQELAELELKLMAARIHLQGVPVTETVIQLENLLNDMFWIVRDAMDTRYNVIQERKKYED